MSATIKPSTLKAQTKAPRGRLQNRVRFVWNPVTARDLLFLSIISFAIYCPTLWSGFVADDNAEVLQDPLIRSFANIPVLFAHSVWFFLNGGVGDRFYRPLKLLAYTAEYRLFSFQLLTGTL